MYRGGSADVSSKKAIPIWIHSAPEHRWSQSRGGGGRGQWLLLSWQWWGGSPGHHSTPLTTTDRWWMMMMATSLCSHHRFRHTWRNIPDVVNPLRYPLSWTPIASLIGFLNGPAGTPLSGTWPAAPVATPTLLGYYDCAPHAPRITGLPFSRIFGGWRCLCHVVEFYPSQTHVGVHMENSI